MPSPQSSKFADILQAIARELATRTRLDPSAVRVAASDHYERYVPSIGDRGLLVRYYGPEPDTNAGTGRRARRWKRLVRVYVFTRDGLDQAGEDGKALFQDGGHCSWEELVVDVLDEYWPTSLIGKTLTIEPLHPLNSAEGPPVRKSEDDLGWITSHLDFECHYVGATSD